MQAHRGYCVNGAPENSLSSIIAAFELGYEMAEFDVRLTADNVCILFHDSMLKNIKIRNMPLQTIRSQIEITTLQDVFEWLVKTRNFKLNIEIKSRDVVQFALEKQVAALIRKFGLERRVLVSSFNPFSLYKIRMFCPKVYRAILLTLGKDHGNNIFTRSLLLNYLCRPHILNLRFADYSERFRILAKTIPVVLWTVNDLRDYRRVETEIHGIISDVIKPADLKAEHDAEIH